MTEPGYLFDPHVFTDDYELEHGKQDAWFSELFASDEFEEDVASLVTLPPPSSASLASSNARS